MVDKKILVIEDDAETQEIIQDCLTAEGCSVVKANNGYLGVQQAQEHLPDLIVCDIVMPDLDGYGVLEKLRHNSATATIPLIFLTAKSERAEWRQAMVMGADDYITKPFTAEELIGAIAARLEYRNLLKQFYVADPSPISPSVATDGGALDLPKPFDQEQKTGTLRDTEQHFQFPEHPQLTHIFQFIEANYHQSISLNEIAQAFNYSPSYLTSLVHRLTGQTLYQWIVQRRMFQARYLLLKTDWPVHKIANAVGYVDTGHFVKHFRQLHKQPPKTWRDIHLQN